MGRPNWLKNLLRRQNRRRQISDSNENMTENDSDKSDIEMTIPSWKGNFLSSSLDFAFPARLIILENFPPACLYFIPSFCVH